METVPRAGWQHPGRGAASPPHGRQWARVRELGSCALPTAPLGFPVQGEMSPASSPQLCFPLGVSPLC